MHLPQRKSALHRRVAELLRKAFPNFTVWEEHPIKVQLSGRVSTLFVDIIVKELNLAVECHGRQHFDFSPHLHGTRDAFARSVERDQSKAEQLKDAGFAFLVVRYDEQKKLTVPVLMESIENAIRSS